MSVDEDTMQIIKCYNCIGLGHYWHENCPEPKRHQDSDLIQGQDATLMQAQEMVQYWIGKKQLLFLVGEQVTNFDDVDDPTEQDLALNVHHIFEADQCDAFDSDVDEALKIHDLSW
ncbi:hypothetical protein Tco_0628610 [Tanacetum coccineum]|uniref:CCHC-type domain-containing protein n=1 Tax=Tanacetum coccineum TaxID=301880 RepID=A0ABQ4WR04_9ASTR